MMATCIPCIHISRFLRNRRIALLGLLQSFPIKMVYKMVYKLYKIIKFKVIATFTNLVFRFSVVFIFIAAVFSLHSFLWSRADAAQCEALLECQFVEPWKDISAKCTSACHVAGSLKVAYLSDLNCPCLFNFYLQTYQYKSCA